MKEMIFLSVCPDDLYFYWQLRVQLYNFRRLGFKQEYHILLYTPQDRADSPNSIFDKLKEDFEGVEIFRYIDYKGECLKFIQHFDYVSLLRPWTARKHFDLHPELKDVAIFYIDQDIIFTKYLDFTPFLQDEVNYLSWTGSRHNNYNYLNKDYFDNQVRNIEASKLERFKEVDPIGKLAQLCGISNDILAANNQKTGGAQYLLKNIDGKFWADVFDYCLVIKSKMEQMNQIYFKGSTIKERNDNGYQAWCADMWAVLWNLWKRNYETECPPELDFAWATDLIDKWDNVYIYHHAGAPQIEHNGKMHSLFNKRKLDYVNNVKTPFEDRYYVNETSRDFCAYKYAQEILNTT